MSYKRINIKTDMRRKRAENAVIIIFAAILFGTAAALVLLSRPTVSRTENRELEKLPELSAESYLDGSFFMGLDKYYTDTVPFRDRLNEYAARIKNTMGIPAPQFYGVEIVNDIRTAEETEPEPVYTTTLPEVTTSETEQAVTVTEGGTTVTETETTVTETTIVTTENDEKFTGDINDFLNNGILVNGVDMYGEKAGVMLFGGSKKQGERYANIINSYKERLGDGVNVYNMVVPTSVEFYLPSKYSRYSNPEKDQIDFIYSKLRNVTPVDAYSVLAEHKDEYIYFRTDHHWTDLGAYYAYTAFCGALGQTPPALTDYDIITKDEPYVGSLYGYTNDITLKNNPDTFTYYKTRSAFTGENFYYDTLKPKGANPIYHEYAAGSSMYSMFLGSDAVHVKITTNAGTGRKIVMFKESYGNAFAPYLIDSFDEIYVIDIRYFGRNAVDYIKEVGATDVLFINNVFAANTSTLISGIERLLTSPTGTIVTAAAASTTVPTTSSASVPVKSSQTTQSSQTSETAVTTVTETVSDTESTETGAAGEP